MSKSAPNLRPLSAAAPKKLIAPLGKTRRPSTAGNAGLGAAQRRPVIVGGYVFLDPSASNSATGLPGKAPGAASSASTVLPDRSSTSQPTLLTEVPSRGSSRPATASSSINKRGVSADGPGRRMARPQSSSSCRALPVALPVSRVQSAPSSRASSARSQSKGLASSQPSSALPKKIANFGKKASPVAQDDELAPLTAGLCEPTNSQNKKAAETAASIARCQKREEEQLRSGMASSADVEVLELNSAKFGEELREFEAELAECARCVRMEHYTLNADGTHLSEEEQRRRAEQQRRIADKERRLRQMAKDCLNPKVRVAAQLERYRMCTALNVASSRVPERTMVLSLTGKTIETVSVVDVEELQNQCLAFDKGSVSSYAKVHEAHHQAFVRRNWAKHAYPDGARHKYVEENMLPDGDAMLSRTESLMVSKLTHQQRKREARQMRAASKRQRLAEEKCAKAVDCLGRAWNLDELPACNEATEKAIQKVLAERPAEETDSDDGSNPDDHEVGGEAGPKLSMRRFGTRDVLRVSCSSVQPQSESPLAADGSPSRAASPSSMAKTAKRASFQVPVDAAMRTPQKETTGMSRPSSSRMSRRGSTPSKATLLSPKRSTSHGSPPGSRACSPKLKRAASKAVDDPCSEPQRSVRASKLWAIARAAVMAVLLFRSIQRRNAAAHVVKNLVQSIARMTLARKSMRLVRERIAGVQRLFRAHRRRRDRWCKQFSQTWIKIEAEHMSNYFRELDLIEMQSGNLDGSNRPSWQKFRVPVEQRKKALQRWYLAQLRRAAQILKGFQKRAEQANTHKRDLQDFYNKFPAECGMPQEYSLANIEMAKGVSMGGNNIRSTLSSFGENDVLALIAWSARDLAERGVAPFPQHPAARASPSSLEKGSSSKSRTRRKNMKSSNVTAERKGLPAWLNPQHPEPDGVDESGEVASLSEPKSASLDVANDAPAGKEQVNVDDLFRRFTPRLREIRRAGTLRIA